jgi:DNA-binding beta-propeller fold protein YncE
LFQGNLEHPPTGEFFPRSVVIGPDGLLYVSVRNNPNTAEGQLGGRVVRYNPKTKDFIDVFIEGNSIPNFNRPEGLVFGPDGNLYITSFRRDPNDTDKILIFDSKGRFLDKIDLYAVGQPRAFAQAILFGPNDKLFVPITGPGPAVTGTPLGPDTGSVRRYNVKNKTFDVFVRPALLGGPLSEPWYLTFGKTDPATLAYGHDKEESSDHDHHHDDESSD